MALELLSQLCTFEYSLKCSKVSFDSDSLFRIAKRSIGRFLVNRPVHHPSSFRLNKFFDF